ncbi:class I SAM-dependent methyltransferase [Sphingomonas japonica]|uniref:SAM-dependent methyltransferase n=1 Tax=Sphingomonas japonica TaxID=511662 RepID=A0ABX0U102_9SPHN|nr:class I SAM-dependent methyltransferase [Sphingomonas japonica]NIJ24241.1 SAM-dependent methyltransferase [Sphingomonas japonica]
MTTVAIRDDATGTKANMSAIYDQADPRAYFRELGKLDYAIPAAAQPVFQRMVDAIRARRKGTVHALDLGCSYGINAALLKYPLAMADLQARWTDPVLHGIDSDAVREVDRAYFDAQPCADVRVIGLDPSEPAIAYAEDVGILDDGVTLDLERNAVPPALAETLAPIDMIVSTGCVGYVTQRTFAALMPAVTAGAAPWIGNFVLRMFPYDAIEQTLGGWGYVTEKLEGETFAQRAFASDIEQERVMAQVDRLGLDTAGLEADGALHAEFFLSRPKNEADIPLADLIDQAT